MRRRTLLALAAILAARPALAQPAKPPRVGFLYFGTQRSATELGRYEGFLQGMRALGYAPGKDFAVEARFGDSNAERTAAHAKELARLKVDVIVAGGTAANRAAQAATKSIPIVIAISPDPVLEGFAASLARPGGNVTGLSTNTAEVDLKHVELLKSAVPRLAQIAVLSNPANGAHPARLKAVQSAAHARGVAVVHMAAGTPDGIEAAFRSIAQGADGLIILGDTFFVQQAKQLANLALSHRIPSVFTSREYAEAGGFMAYAANLTNNYRRAAAYVDKILKGAKPADLPIEQPTQFELVVNLKTAKALGIAVPQTILVRADRVIE